MKKILILSGSQNYAASTASSTASTATDPTLLALGAPAFYGLVEVDSGGDGNDNKDTLITPTDLAVPLKISAANFIAGGGNLVRFMQGYPTNVNAGQGSLIQAKGVTRLWKQAYIAPIKEVSYIGYNGTGGSLNLPTITLNSEGTLLAVQQEVTTPDQIREQEQYGTANLLANTAAYDIVLQIVNAVNNTTYKTHTAQIVTNQASIADWTGTGTALLLTKGSKTASFVIQDATGWIASTGTATIGDIFYASTGNTLNATFTANALGSSAGHHIITINDTQYVVADAGTAAQNAAAIITAINAGSQGTATLSNTSDVTIAINRATYSAKIGATYSADDSTWTVLTITVNNTVGASTNTVGTILKAASAASAAASFQLDAEFQGQSGYYLGGTSTTVNAGIATLAGSPEYGIKLTVDDPNSVYQYARQGVIESATITYTIGANCGLGTGDELSKIEEGLIAYRGQFDNYSKWMKQLPRFAVITQNYDAYTIMYRNTTVETGFDNNKGDNSTIQIYVPSGFAGQANIETVLKGLFTSALANF